MYRVPIWSTNVCCADNGVISHLEAHTMTAALRDTSKRVHDVRLIHDFLHHKPWVANCNTDPWQYLLGDLFELTAETRWGLD